MHVVQPKQVKRVCVHQREITVLPAGRSNAAKYPLYVPIPSYKQNQEHAQQGNDITPLCVDPNRALGSDRNH
jgi:hypothetical protein